MGVCRRADREVARFGRSACRGLQCQPAGQATVLQSPGGVGEAIAFESGPTGTVIVRFGAASRVLAVPCARVAGNGRRRLRTGRWWKDQ